MLYYFILILKFSLLILNTFGNYILLYSKFITVQNIL